MKKRLLAKLAIALLATSSVSSCGRSSPPSCSNDAAEKMVKHLIMDIKEGQPTVWTELLQVGKDSVYIYVKINVAKLNRAFNLKFQNERERSYDVEPRKRYCTADISGTIDEDMIAESFELTGSSIIFRNETNSVGKEGHALVTNQSRENIYNDHPEENDLTEDEKTKANQFLAEDINNDFLAQIRWRNPQTYSIQVTDHDDIFVTLNE